MPPDVATDWVPGRSGSSGPLAHCDAGVVQGKAFFLCLRPSAGPGVQWGSRSPFAFFPGLLAVVGSLGGGISVPVFTDQAGAVLLLLWLFWMSTVWLDVSRKNCPPESAFHFWNGGSRIRCSHGGNEREEKPTGLRFVHWVHHDPQEAARADPPPDAARAVYLQIESCYLSRKESNNILVLTTRKNCATGLRSFCHQSRRSTNVETAVKVAGATAKHCIVLHGQSSFLSGLSNGSDFDKECYTRANVALSRATDLTVLACPLNMHGLEGATQVIAALLHGACTLHTDNTSSCVAHVTGTFEVGPPDVQAETVAFRDATELHPMWEGRTPLCLAEYYEGKVRRLRLVLAKQSCLLQSEQNQFQNPIRSLHGSGLLFGYAADGLAHPVVSDTNHPEGWRLLHAGSKAGGSRFTIGSTVRYPPGMGDAASKARLYRFEPLHTIYFYDAWRSEPILDGKGSSLILPPAPGLLQEGCFWRQPAASPPVLPSPTSTQRAGSPVSAGQDDPCPQEDPSLPPSPLYTNSGQVWQDQPVSVSSQEEADSFPTQASELRRYAFRS